MSLKEYLTGLSGILSNIEASGLSNSPMDIDEALDTVVNNIVTRGTKVILIGNGGSASIASHIAVDFWKNGGIQATAFNDSSLLTCVSNDYGFEHVFEKPIEMFAEEGDIVFAISSSGQSINMLNGVDAAKKKNCMVVTLSGFSSDNPLRTMGQINFYVPSDAYGFVELAHSAICHSIADIITSKNKVG